MLLGQPRNRGLEIELAQGHPPINGRTEMEAQVRLSCGKPFTDHLLCTGGKQVKPREAGTLPFGFEQACDKTVANTTPPSVCSM